MLPYKVMLSKTGSSFALDFAPVKPVLQEWLPVPSPFVSVSCAPPAPPPPPSPVVFIALPLNVHNSIELNVHKTEFAFDVCTVRKRILHFHKNTRGTRSPNNEARFGENAAPAIFKAASLSSQSTRLSSERSSACPLIQPGVARSPLCSLSFLTRPAFLQREGGWQMNPVRG